MCRKAAPSWRSSRAEWAGSSCACSGTNPQDHGTRHLALTKTRPMTSQDLFKTGESFLFFTDLMKHTSTEDREGVLTNTLRLQSCPFHLASQESLEQKQLPFSALPVFQHEKQSMLSLPTTPEACKWQTCSPPMQKSTQQSRDPLYWPAEGWNSSSSSSVVFVLMGTASNSTIAKVEQQRAGKRH